LIHLFTKKVLADVDRVYAVSHNICTQIITVFNTPATKVRYLPFGIDSDLFTPLPDKKPGYRTTVEVFSNRGFFPVYDNETLVRGFASAYRENNLLRLTLKGEGPDEQKVRDLVSSLGIADVVTFKKKTDYLDVPKDYRNADIFVTTSQSDGTPVSVLEAMASGLPCIATTVGGIPEWVEDMKNGILISPGSSEHLAEKILLLARNPGLSSELGNAARETITRNGQWNTLMAQAEKDYQALIKTYRQERS
jgi:glycosyltransferase involved in cell wall biosynthesis